MGGGRKETRLGMHFGNTLRNLYLNELTGLRSSKAPDTHHMFSVSLSQKAGCQLHLRCIPEVAPMPINQENSSPASVAYPILPALFRQDILR